MRLGLGLGLTVPHLIGGGGFDSSGFILWNGVDYLTIDASGDKFFISLQ
jgi:hypothetical protein